MKYLKLFENFEDDDEYIDDVQDDVQVEDVRVRPYAKGEIINGTIVVDATREFTDNPLFYMWSEYPKYKLMQNPNGSGFLRTNYGFFTDKDKNKYILFGDLTQATEEEIANLIEKWGTSRDVDAFVDGADKDDYVIWLDSIA